MTRHFAHPRRKNDNEHAPCSPSRRDRQLIRRGPEITPIEDTRAMRSAANYPHLPAQRLDARLTDLTVSGATTATFLDTDQRMLWRRFPP